MKNKNTIKDPFAEREAQKYAQPIASREFILSTLKASKKPCSLDQLAKLLNIKAKTDKEALSHRLSAMVRDGQLILNRREGYLPVNDRDLVRGRVIAHPDGYGFLALDEGGDDLFISTGQMRGLLHDDKVVMRKTAVNRKGRCEVSLVEVIERGQSRLVGQFFVENNIAFVVPDNKRIAQDILVPMLETGDAQHGQIVVADIIEQPTKRQQPIGKVIEVLGDHMAPGMEIDVAINSYELPVEWPDELLQEIQALGPDVLEEDKQERADYREVPFVTIDGDDARDFDDAVYCESYKGGWRLFVAIADVSHYVQTDTALDQEAENRGTSVYFPGRVIPMLPEVLSNGLCSLNPNVDRLAMVCKLQINKQGQVESYNFKEAVIRSHARLTYDEVASLLVDQDSELREKYESITPKLEALYELYQAFYKARVQRGAIDFDTTETKIVFGDDKKIESIKPLSRNDAHRLIEECMIAANVAAASFIAENKIPGLYRIHEPPTFEKVEELALFLNELGLKFPIRKDTNPKTSDYAKLLNSIKERPDAHLVQTVMLRSLKQAIYSPDNYGHFGLSLEKYAHFTSPIRRYPDLLVHRAIRHILKYKNADKYSYSTQQMLALGEHCSMTERRADEATRGAVEWLKCEYMLDKVGQEFDGLITGVTSFGLFVELNDLYIEGLIHVSALQQDYYHHDAIGHRLEGESTGRVFRLADPVKVIVNRVDLDDRKIDFIPADSVDYKPRKKRRRKF